MFKQKIIIITLVLTLSLFVVGCKKETEQTTNTEPATNTVTGTVIVNLNPVSPKVKIGELAKIAVNLNTNNTSVNTAQIVLNYDAEKLDYDSTSTVSSAFSIWIKKDGADGQVNLVSAEPSPGVEGNDVYVGTVVFKAKELGSSPITLDQSLSKMITSDEIDMIRSEGHKNTEITIE